MTFRQPVVTVTLNPAIDQTLSIPGFTAGRVNRVAESRSDAGGKGVNVASFLADLGIDVIVTGFLGLENAALFEALFERKRIADRFVRIAGSTRVGIKIVDERTHETTDINFPGLSPTAEDVDELLGRIASLTAPGRWFVLSGSVPPGVPDNIYATLIETIHKGGGHVVLDTSGSALREALAGAPDVVPEIIKPNMEELGELVGRPLDTPAEVRAAGESLLERGVRRVVVSMGGAGAVFLESGRALLARPPEVPVRSTVGAGDAMVSGIVFALIHGLPLEDVARTATASGAYAVTGIGAGIEDPAEHRKLMDKVRIEGL
jgi:1-phosphofructokinase family hexose kinase